MPAASVAVLAPDPALNAASLHAHKPTTSLVDELLQSTAKSMNTSLVDAILKAAPQAAAQASPAIEPPFIDDAIDHWREARERVDARRAALADAQLAVRGAASLEEGEVAAEALAAAATARNEARVSLIDELDEALALHERWDAEGQCGRLQAEAARLAEAAAADAPGALGAALTRRLRLERLQAQMLPALDEWLGRFAGWRAEVDALRPHRAGAPPSLEELRGLRDAWFEALDALDVAKLQASVRPGRPAPTATKQEALRAAQRAVQQAERGLRVERARLSSLAATHFPELLAAEELLRLGAAEGPVFQAKLVQRQLEQYSGREVIADLLSARHRVLRSSWQDESSDGAVPCALKEYVLDDSGTEWTKLVREVTVLATLAAGSPRFVEVQAVFQQIDEAGQNLAYVQLPLFERGDARRWLDEQEPTPTIDERRKMLRELAEALLYLHSLGYAHGDIKLENVLISAHGSAHLADFESVREQPTAAGPTASRTSRTAGRSGAAVATRKYEAPEMRTGTVPKATAASDMYSYGVCALLACCDETDYEFDDTTDALQGWDRNAAGAKGGEHLPALLDKLLDLQQPPAASVAEAVGRRISAREALCRYPFLDPAAEQERARLKTEAAAAASHEAAEQLAAVQRQAEWNEAELQRMQADEEQKLMRAVEEARLQAEAQKAEIKARQCRMEVRSKALRELEAKAGEACTEAVKVKAEVCKEKKQLAEEAAMVDKKKAELHAQEKKIEAIKEKHTDALWLQLAHGIDTDAAVRKFFAERQPPIGTGVLNPWSGHVSHSHPPVKIKEAIKVVNQARLKAFLCSGGFDMNTTKAGQQHVDTLLFHGCSPEAAANIQAEGLLLKFGGKNGSMLGAGLYGAPDPRKSVTYCGKSPMGNFLFVCRFNLSKAKHAGPKTHHKNTVFHEYCVPKESDVVVLWMLKLGK